MIIEKELFSAVLANRMNELGEFGYSPKTAEAAIKILNLYVGRREYHLNRTNIEKMVEGEKDRDKQNTNYIVRLLDNNNQPVEFKFLYKAGAMNHDSGYGAELEFKDEYGKVYFSIDEVDGSLSSYKITKVLENGVVTTTSVGVGTRSTFYTNEELLLIKQGVKDIVKPDFGLLEHNQATIDNLPAIFDLHKDMVLKHSTEYQSTPKNSK